MAIRYLHPEHLVSTDWLSSRIGEPTVRIFECTTYLRYLEDNTLAAYRVESGRADYDQGHIPGAAFLDLQNDFSDNDAPSHLRFRMLPLDQLATRFADAGIGDGFQIVLYSRGAMTWATRLWWMLRAVGFDHAAVLDGGFEKWTAEGRDVITEPAEFDAAQFTPAPRPELFADKDTVVAAMNDESQLLINALTPDLHSGENPRYGRPGRIPGSCNIPAAELVDSATRAVLPAAQIEQRLEAMGATRDGPTVLYCGGGIAATLDAFLMFQLGYQNLSVYDASMSEWARDESLPIERD